MSKIYEALLRAEIERTAAKNAEEERSRREATDSGPNLRPDQQPIAVPAASIAASPSLRPAVPAADLAPEPAVPAPALQQTDAWIESIRTVPWTPDFSRLQSLEDRGGTLEQFRTLRSRIQEFRSLNTLKSILVSSGKPQEGKSFISVNLAVSLARHKSARVLLIDGDMRKSSLQVALGTGAEPGLTDYLSGNASMLDVLQRGTAVAGGPPLLRGLSSLVFLPAGSDAENAADLSGNYRFAELIEAAAPHVDWIIIDSSPVNLVADAVNLARSADAVLLVARGSTTTYQSMRRAMSELKASKLLGVVLNAVEDLPKTEGYYGTEYIKEGEKG